MATFALNVLKFEDIRNQIVQYLSTNSEFSSQFDFTAANISLIIDTMTYVTMLMSYQVSNTANNLFMDTTTIRKNAISIAKTMGYRPRRAISSKVFGTIEYVDLNNTFDSSHTITIPAQSIFISDKGFQYINFEKIELKVSPTNPNKLESSIILTEGIRKTFTYLGNGQPFQNFIISSKKVEENNFELFVRKNTEQVGILWNEVKQSFNLLNTNSYFVEEDIVNEGYVRVVFGNGDVTNYPSNSEIIDINYLETNSTDANGSKVVKLPSNIELSTAMQSIFDVTNFTAISTTTGTSYGGKSLETLEEIKENAAKSFASVGRAVTQNDYNTLLSQYPYIYRANTIGGDELYPSDPNELGNIYISCIPVITDIFNLYDNDVLYLTPLEEATLENEINTRRVISTQINFLKPSYVHVDLTPIVETKSNLTALETVNIKTDISNNLNNYVKANFTDYNLVFRASKINGIINETANVLSADVSCKYSFALTKESFYETSNIENSSIYLPVKVKEKDQLGNVIGYENFVKTNVEQMDNLNKPELALTDRTIYGKINHNYLTRYLYNEDVVVNNEPVQMCNLLLNGENTFFTFYRFDDNSSFIKFTKSDGLTVTVTPSASSPNNSDNYIVSINNNATDVVIGTVKRTQSFLNGFKGLVSNEGEILDNTNGSFYQASLSFNVSGSDKNFSSITKNDYIIYNSNLSGGKWIKTNNLGQISAIDDSQLFTSIPNNGIYFISGSSSGTFENRIMTPVTSGDYIIFNVNSTINPSYKWEKINFRPSLDTLEVSANLPKEVVPFELKRVIGLDILTPTNFNGKTSLNFFEDDLIFYDNSTPSANEPDKWKLLGNVGASAIYGDFPNTIDADPISGCTLELLSYHPVTGVQIGDCYRVVGIGDFGIFDSTSAIKVNWPLDAVAYDFDIIVYAGYIDGYYTWNIWQETSPDTFNIDGNISSDLPIKINYADAFPVNGLNGTFNDYFTDVTFSSGDHVVYTDNNSWIKLITLQPVSGLNPVSASFLPPEASIGDSYVVNEAGNFSNSYMISPSGDNFIVGDYIIYNGTHFTKMKEYTFEYAQIDISNDGADYLNTLGFNSTFRYEYDYATKYYNVYFDDMYNGVKLGEFRYINTDSSISALYTIGKITFEPYVTGTLDGFNTIPPIPIKNLFDTTINQINFVPRNQIDINGTVTSEPQTDFNTNFNTVVTFTILEAITTQ